MTGLASSAPDLSDAVYSHDIPAERPWSRVLKQGQTLRIIDSEGQQAVDALLYCAEDPAERYSSQDTLRVQGSAYIELGTQLISNKGPGDGPSDSRFLRTPRYVGGVLLLRKQRCALWGRDQIPARLPRELHP